MRVSITSRSQELNLWRGTPDAPCTYPTVPSRLLSSESSAWHQVNSQPVPAAQRPTGHGVSIHICSRGTFRSEPPERHVAPGAQEKGSKEEGSSEGPSVKSASEAEEGRGRREKAQDTGRLGSQKLIT